MSVNASSIAVYQASWLPPDKWQWSVAGPDGMTFGTADSEREAWADARECHAALEATNAALRHARGQG